MYLFILNTALTQYTLLTYDYTLGQGKRRFNSVDRRQSHLTTMISKLYLCHIAGFLYEKYNKNYKYLYLRANVRKPQLKNCCSLPTHTYTHARTHTRPRARTRVRTSARASLFSVPFTLDHQNLSCYQKKTSEFSIIRIFKHICTRSLNLCCFRLFECLIG